MVAVVDRRIGCCRPAVDKDIDWDYHTHLVAPLLDDSKTLHARAGVTPVINTRSYS